MSNWPDRNGNPPNSSVWICFFYVWGEGKFLGRVEGQPCQIPVLNGHAAEFSGFDLVFRVSGFVFRVSGFVFRVSGFVFLASGFGMEEGTLSNSPGLMGTLPSSKQPSDASIASGGAPYLRGRVQNRFIAYGATNMDQFD